MLWALAFLLLPFLLFCSIFFPLSYLTDQSYTYLISNPTDQQLQELQYRLVCRPSTSYFISLPTSCIQVHSIDFLSTITLGEERLLKVKISDRDGGKIEEFIKAVGVEYIEWDK